MVVIHRFDCIEQLWTHSFGSSALKTSWNAVLTLQSVYLISTSRQLCNFVILLMFRYTLKMHKIHQIALWEGGTWHSHIHTIHNLLFKCSQFHTFILWIPSFNLTCTCNTWFEQFLALPILHRYLWFLILGYSLTSFLLGTHHAWNTLLLTILEQRLYLEKCVT